MNNNIQRRRSNVGLMTSSLVQKFVGIWIFLCGNIPSETAQLSDWHMGTFIYFFCFFFLVAFKGSWALWSGGAGKKGWFN